jgi:hypothetical protein
MQHAHGWECAVSQLHQKEIGVSPHAVILTAPEAYEN